MIEAIKNSFSGLVHNPDVQDWVIRHLPDEHVEYLILSNRESSVRVQGGGKYDDTLLILNALSNFNPLTRLCVGPAPGHGLYPAAYPSYMWGRWNDNLADGDDLLPSGYHNYEGLVQVQKDIISSRIKSVTKAPTIEFLLKGVITKLERVQKPNDNIRSDLSSFLDTMLTEYFRRIGKAVSTQQELTDLYAKSFGIPHNIMLISFGSSIRSDQIPELAQIQGRLFNSEADSLYEDLQNGICYIPTEVLSTSGLCLEDLMQNPSLTQTNPVIQGWRNEEIRACSGLYASLLKKSKNLDWKAKLYIEGLTKNFESITNSTP